MYQGHVRLHSCVLGNVRTIRKISCWDRVEIALEMRCELGTELSLLWGSVEIALKLH